MTDPRLLLPLNEQIKRLRDLACDVHPGQRFIRTVPVQPTDHDIMLIELCDKAETMAAYLRDIAEQDWDPRDDVSRGERARDVAREVLDKVWA